MPSLELRGRYLLREYWGDSELFKKLDAAEREIYIGLWMLADDDGWLPRDVPEIAAALLRFEAPDSREVRTRAALEKLRRLGKVRSHRCGCLEIPAVPRYKRPGNKSAVHYKEHQDKHVQTSSTMFGGGLNTTSSRSNLISSQSASAREAGPNGRTGPQPIGEIMGSAKEELDRRWKRPKA